MTCGGGSGPPSVEMPREYALTRNFRTPRSILRLSEVLVEALHDGGAATLVARARAAEALGALCGVSRAAAAAAARFGAVAPLAELLSSGDDAAASAAAHACAGLARCAECHQRLVDARVTGAALALTARAPGDEHAAEIARHLMSAPAHS